MTVHVDVIKTSMNQILVRREISGLIPGGGAVMTFVKNYNVLFC